MKKWMKKYSRTCRASLMLLLVYSTHLFSFHSLIANPGQFLTGIVKSAKSNTSPHRHTDSLLLLSKHELAKHKEEGNGGELTAAHPASAIAQFHYPALVSFNNSPQNRSNNSYKLYSLLSTWLI